MCEGVSELVLGHDYERCAIREAPPFVGPLAVQIKSSLEEPTGLWNDFDTSILPNCLNGLNCDIAKLRPSVGKHVEHLCEHHVAGNYVARLKLPCDSNGLAVQSI